MKKLIDACDLWSDIMMLPHNGDMISSEEVEEAIKDAPTVDAVEVVHGRWKPVDHDGSWRVDMCSVCHRRMHYVDYDQPYQYCPNCGAKMDGERKENE